MTFFTITYCKSLHVVALSSSVSLLLANLAASFSFIFHLLCCFLFLLPRQSSIVLPICRHLETLFFSLCGRSVLSHRWFSSSATHDEMTDKWEQNEGKMKKQLEYTKSTSCMWLKAVCVWVLACLSGRFLSLCKCVDVNNQCSTLFQTSSGYIGQIWWC